MKAKTNCYGGYDVIGGSRRRCVSAAALSEKGWREFVSVKLKRHNLLP